MLHAELVDVQHRDISVISLGYQVVSQLNIIASAIVLGDSDSILDEQGDVLLGGHEPVGALPALERVQQWHHRQLQLEGARVDVLVVQHVVQDLDGRVAGEVDVFHKLSNSFRHSDHFQLGLQNLQAGECDVQR